MKMAVFGDLYIVY